LNYGHDSDTDVSFAVEPSKGDWIPIVGDWDGDDECSAGLYDPVKGRFYLKNSLADGRADYIFTFGKKDSGWLPIVGDWDGDGIDGIGVYNPRNARFYLKDVVEDGNTKADHIVRFGPPDFAGWVPVAGDWDGDGNDGIGLYEGKTSTFFLNNELTDSSTDIRFDYGPNDKGWLPLVGSW
jgi:hypothetical protein